MASTPSSLPSNYYADRTVGLTVAIVLTRAIGWTAVALRFLARRVGGAKLWWDDWLVLTCGIIMIPATVDELQLVNMHMGRHMDWVVDNAPNVFGRFAAGVYQGVLYYAPLVGGAKLSILFLYIRLFGAKRQLRLVCYVLMGLLVCWIIVTECVFAFRCNPVRLGWALSTEGGTCIPMQRVFVGTNAVDVAFNFALLITPLPVLWSLQLPFKKKVLVSAVLFVGCAESILSILRLWKVASLTWIDYTWDTATADLWSLIQANLGLMCACIPVLGPLLPRSWVGGTRTSVNDSRTKKQRVHSVDQPTGFSLDKESELPVVEEPPTAMKSIYLTTEFSVHTETTPPASVNESSSKWYA